MAYRQYCVVTGILLSLVALAHLLRILNGMPVVVGAYDVPMLVSWFGFVVPAALAFWAFRILGS
jgi:hypothetical protein